MQFSNTGLELTNGNLKPDKNLRTLYKSMMNSIVGKFSQRETYPNTKYVSGPEEIEEIFLKGREEIRNFQTIGSDVCELQISPLRQETKENRKSNPIITAFVTSLSRIDMHQNILLLKKAQFDVLYTDTDSLIFTGKTETPLPFETNGGLGYFRPEYENLSGFCCIGKKSYAVTSTVDKKTEMKVCGLSFESQEAQSAISFTDFKNFLEQNSMRPKTVPQSRTNHTTLPFSVQKVIKQVQIPTTLNYNRILKKECNYFVTEPYGFMPKK